MFGCDLCDLTFSTRNRRKTHRKGTHGTLQCRCRRMFVYDNEMEQHKKAMIENAKAYQCPDCCLSFHSEDGRQQHLRKFNHGCPEDLVFVELSTTKIKTKKRKPRRIKIGSGDHKCDYCTRRFEKPESLLHHRKSKGHLVQSTEATKSYLVPNYEVRESYLVPKSEARGSYLVPNSEARKSYLDDFYERNVKVDKQDMAASREIVNTTLNKLMQNVRQQPGGTLFNPNVIKAGSVPINAKIGKADEFDTNVELNVTPTDVRQTGNVNYTYVSDVNTVIFRYIPTVQ